MQRQIFRQRSLDRISSPEQLQDYMKVTNPGIWMVLAAVIALLVGLLVSSALVTIESSVPVQGEVLEDGVAIFVEMPLGQKDAVQPGMAARVAGRDAHIDFIFQDNEALSVVVALDDESDPLPAGVYDVEIVTEKISPISFLLN